MCEVGARGGQLACVAGCAMWAGWSHEPSCCGCGPHNAHGRPYRIRLVYCAETSCTCRATPWLGKGHGDGRAVLGVRSGARVRELLGPPCGGGLTRVRPSARGGDVCVCSLAVRCRSPLSATPVDLCAPRLLLECPHAAASLAYTCPSTGGCESDSTCTLRVHSTRYACG